VLVPRPGASSVLDYLGSGLSAGVASAPGGQVLFLGVPFEGLVSPSRRGYLMGSFLSRTGVLATAPSPPVGEEPPPPEPGAPNQWEPLTPADPAVPRPPPPPPPPPPSEVLDRLPEFYELAETGCGCGSGNALVPGAWLMLMMSVQRRRTRRRRPFTDR
jgi:hypothetical protein